MIRRGFWLFAGAALGVTGYRKASRLMQALTGHGLLGGPAATQHDAVRRPAAAHAMRAGRAQRQLVPPRLAPPFVAPPFAGPPFAGPPFAGPPFAGPPFAAPPGQLAGKHAPVKPTPVQSTRVTGAARIAAAATRAAAAAGFVRDVREGMAEYWDLHRSESDRTLGSRRDHMWSGDGQQGPRQH